MEKHEINNAALLKLSLYLISLWILLFMLIVLKLDITNIKLGIGKEQWFQIIKENMVSCVSLVLMALGGIGYIFFLDALKNAKNLPVQIEECKSVNYENLSFLATYIIPLVCFPMETEREIFVLFAVIIIIGCIFVKTNLFYTNPSLVLLGFNIYLVSDTTKKIHEDILIVRGTIKKSDTVKYIKLSDNVYFARRI